MNIPHARLVRWLSKNERRILLISVFVFVGAVGTYALIKLAAHGYNALDLAIFAQVIDQSSHGQLFGFGIHPHLYLGDHIDLSLLLFVPFWKLLPHPGTLLVLQAVILALGVWPLWLLVREHVPLFRLGIVWTYLGTVLVHNIAVFEFHTLALVVPLLLTAILGFTERRFRLFVLALLGTLMVREDMGLIVAGFGLLAIVERRPRRWSIPMLILGIGWFLAGVYITSFFNADQYKFLAYYSWLGPSVPAILKNAVLHPWLLVERFFAPQNVLFAAVGVLLFAGLPLLGGKKLLPSLFFATALFLTGFGGDDIALRTHYMAVLVPFLLWATIAGFDRIRERGLPFGNSVIDHPTPLAWLALAGTTLYGYFALSPLGPAGIRSLLQVWKEPSHVIASTFVADVPNDARVAASFSVLQDLVRREELYSLHYVFAGKRQLSSRPYELPAATDWILYDARDYLFYAAQWNGQEKFTGGDARLRAVLKERNFGLVALEDSYLLFQRNVTGQPSLYEVGAVAEGRAVAEQPDATLQLRSIAGQKHELTTETVTFGNTTRTMLPITLTWNVRTEHERPLELRFQLTDTKGTFVYERRYPVAYGLFPTTEWTVGEPVAVRYRFLVPDLPQGTYTVQIQAASTKSYLALDPKLSARVAVTDERLDGKPWVLGMLSQ